MQQDGWPGCNNYIFNTVKMDMGVVIMFCQGQWQQIFGIITKSKTLVTNGSVFLPFIVKLPSSSSFLPNTTGKYHDKDQQNKKYLKSTLGANND